jgi:hypothetical protein
MAGNPLEGVGEKNAHSRPDLLDGEGNKILNTKGLPIKTRQYEFRTQITSLFLSGNIV